MGHRKVIGIITAVMLLACLAAVPVMAQPLPCAFAGTVTLDGAPSPGSTVEARVDATVVGTAEVTGESEYYMVIAQDFDTGVPAEGDTLNFYVDGNLGGTGIWNAGGIKTLDLAATEKKTIEDQLAPIAEYVQIVYYFDNATKAWSYYWPGVGGTLDVLTTGSAYWINVSAHCTIDSTPLYAGLNLMVW